MDRLKHRIREEIGRRPYLLVLDDAWNEDRYKWLQLMDLLTEGGIGSRVLVTSRSKEVARIIGGALHELKGLSPEKSWDLFAKMAFEKGEEQKDVELVGIGKQIIEKCANVPLALRVVGSLLYGQSKGMWLAFSNKDLVNIRPEQNSVIPILKVSYHHLASPLKSCFSYCALFPKDYKIYKDTLISLWMANGFVLPSEDQGVEDACEEYFLALLQRCFFQDVVRNECGEIVSCKMHDLIHDVATEVVGKDIMILTHSTSNFPQKTRHISVEGYGVDNIASVLAEMKSLRTFYILSSSGFLLHQSRIHHKLSSKARYLRVLNLCGSDIRTLPSTIHRLLHLRYIDLSRCYMLENLPASLAELNNLQTLKLRDCRSLKQLPKGLSKLVDLRHLDINRCERLTQMPPGMKSLIHLQTLPFFVVGMARSFGLKRPRVGRLEDLKALVNLRGRIEIKVRRDFDTAKATQPRHVGDNGHLKEMFIRWLDLDQHEYSNAAEATTLLEGLQPHPNLQVLHLLGYPGASFPNWTSSKDLAISLPNLVRLEIVGCSSLQNIPLLSRLRNLEKTSTRRLVQFGVCRD